MILTYGIMIILIAVVSGFYMIRNIKARRIGRLWLSVIVFLLLAGFLFALIGHLI